MALKVSTTVKNAMLDAIDTAIGGTAVLKIRSGSAPSAIADADSGDVLASLTLPASWMAAASGGSVVLDGTWQDASADAAGTAGHFRLYANDGTTQHIQGSITATGGGGDMTLDNIVLAAGQQFTVTTFTLTMGN